MDKSVFYFQIEKNGFDGVNIQEILLEMRKDRMGLIQTPDQLRFSYLAIIEGIKQLDPNYVRFEYVPNLLNIYNQHVVVRRFHSK